jgi:hypothetical protein
MGNIADNFKGLPIEDLIVSPLVGMAKGQAKLNDITWKYIKEVAFDEKGNTNAIDVNILRYVKPSDGGTPEAQTLKAKVPMLPLVPLPALAIKTADIEFSMEVQQSEKSEDDHSTEVDSSVNASYKSFWGLKVSASVSGKVSSKSTNTRNTDNSAKYDVKVHAEQLPPTEGMLKLSDALNMMLDPVVLNDDSGGKSQ